MLTREEIRSALEEQPYKRNTGAAFKGKSGGRQVWRARL